MISYTKPSFADIMFMFYLRPGLCEIRVFASNKILTISVGLPIEGFEPSP